METVSLPVRPREGTGKGPARRLRRQGEVPGVVYGRGLAPLHVAVPVGPLRDALAGGHHVVFELGLEGKGRYAVVKELQLHPTRRTIVHIDLQAVDMKAEIESPVSVELAGESPGVKAGGILDHVLREVQVRALPGDIPDAIEIDVSSLEIGDHFRVADLSAPEGVTILNDPEEIIVSVLASMTEEELAEALETTPTPQPVEEAGGEE